MTNTTRALLTSLFICSTIHVGFILLFPGTAVQLKVGWQSWGISVFLVLCFSVPQAFTAKSEQEPVLIDNIKRDIDRLFSDTSTTPGDTRIDLVELIDYIEEKLDALPEEDDEDSE
jgi:hypothetical protein